MFSPEDEGELAQIDREWETERERYLMRSRYTRGRYAPSGAAAAVMAFFVVGVGVFCFAVDFNNPDKNGAGLLALVGWAIIVVGLGISLYQYVRARRYRAAYRAYQKRRAAVWERSPQRDGPSPFP